jgi:hypothetical protein
VNNIFARDYGSLDPDLAQWVLDPKDLDDDDEIPVGVCNLLVPGADDDLIKRSRLFNAMR